jgi:tetratricopeptide (TPR) repeat protein
MDKVLAIAKRAGSLESDTASHARYQRAQALFGLDRNDEALDLITAVVAEHKRKMPDGKTVLFSILTLDARALSRAGRLDEAKAIAAEALAIEHKPQPLDPAILAGLTRLARTGRGY